MFLSCIMTESHREVAVTLSIYRQKCRWLGGCVGQCTILCERCCIRPERQIHCVLLAFLECAILMLKKPNINYPQSCCFMSSSNCCWLLSIQKMKQELHDHRLIHSHFILCLFFIPILVYYLFLSYYLPLSYYIFYPILCVRCESSGIPPWHWLINVGPTTA